MTNSVWELLKLLKFGSPERERRGSAYYIKPHTFPRVTSGKVLAA